MDEHRTLRVSEAVREELGELIEYELDDPRLADISVTHVEVSPDMRHATVKVAAEEPESHRALQALDHASHYLRHELASRLNLRRVPELHFSLDSHPDADTRVEILLRRAKRMESRGAKPS
jgi:ribosome-binding factor A